MKPGDTGGSCYRCGHKTTLIGYSHVVIGVSCPHCSLVVTPYADAMDIDEAKEEFDDEHDVEAAYKEYCEGIGCTTH